MNNVLFLPVKPKWADMIVDGRKSLELRKRAPVSVAGKRCLIYATSPQREVIGSGRVVAAGLFQRAQFGPDDLRRACVTKAEFDVYFGNRMQWAGIGLCETRRFVKSVPLLDLRLIWDLEPPQQWRYIDEKTFTEIVEAGQ